MERLKVTFKNEKTRSSKRTEVQKKKRITSAFRGSLVLSNLPFFGLFWSSVSSKIYQFCKISHLISH